jgi:hypothetical protein
VGPRWISKRQSDRSAKQKHEDLFHNWGKTQCTSLISLDEKDRRRIERILGRLRVTP